MADFMIELKGTPEDVQAMVDKGSRIKGATAYKKKWINPGLCRVWYRGKRTAPNDLVAAIKRKAGLTKAKAKAKPARAKKAKKSDVIMGGSNDGETWTEVNLTTGETVTATPVENGEVVNDD